ncbi:MAG: helix-turn-helix transcriptional regulator [Clostridia bacterium]|nr:helix-turn-helix transcriptional regulator [Clostridia bacterium]
MSYFNIRIPRTVICANALKQSKGTLFPSGNFPAHKLVYCSDGEIEIHANGIPYVLHRDDMLILFSNTDYYGKSACKPQTEILSIHIAPDGEDVFSEYISGHRDGFAEIAPLVQCGDNPKIKKLITDLTATFWLETESARERSSILTNMLFLELAQQTEKSSVKPATLVERCRRLLMNTGDRFLDAGEIAGRLGVSEKRIRELFKNDFGVTPIQYQREIKLNRALALISEYPDARLNDISSNLGYGSEKIFNSCFRSKFGCSPSSYREKIKSGEIKPDFVFRKPDRVENIVRILFRDGNKNICFNVPVSMDETVWFHLNGRTIKSDEYTLKIRVDKHVCGELFDGRLTVEGRIMLDGETLDDYREITAEECYEFTR